MEDEDAGIRYVTWEEVVADVRRIARPLGYAVGLHGSLREHRDIDLIAAPWAEDARPARALVRALDGLPYLMPDKRAVRKPHGRRGWTWIIRYRSKPCPAYLDLSVMPRQTGYSDRTA